MNETSEKKMPEWADNDRLDILEAFRTYLEHRRKEITGALDPGEGLETWDPFLIGFSQGMRTGLEVAEELVYSYSEWVKRENYWPDQRSFKYMDR